MTKSLSYTVSEILPLRCPGILPQDKGPRTVAPPDKSSPSPKEHNLLSWAVDILPNAVKLTSNLYYWQQPTRRVALYLGTHCNIGTKTAFPTGVLYTAVIWCACPFLVSRPIRHWSLVIGLLSYTASCVELTENMHLYPTQSPKRRHTLQLKHAELDEVGWIRASEHWRAGNIWRNLGRRLYCLQTKVAQLEAAKICPLEFSPST